MGSSQSRTLMDVMTEKTTEVISKMEGSCESVVTQTNSIKINCDAINNLKPCLDEEKKEIIDSEGNTMLCDDNNNRYGIHEKNKNKTNDYEMCIKYTKNAKECGFLLADCIVRDVKQTNEGNIKTNCEFDQETLDKLKEEVKQDIENKMNKEEDAFGKALVYGLGTKTKEETNTRLKTIINTTYNSEFLMQLNQRINQTNELVIDSNGKTVIVADLTTKNISNLVGDLIAKNKQVRDISSKMETKAKNSLQILLKGITDIFESILGIFGGMGLIFVIIVVCMIMFLPMILNSGGNKNNTSK